MLRLQDPVSDDNVIHVEFGPGGGRRSPPPQARPGSAKTRARARDRSARDPMRDLYTLEEAARLFDLNRNRLRYWERHGFIERSAREGARRYYTFQDLIGIRAAKGLLDQGVPFRSVRRSVEALRGTLPKVTRPLTTLRIVADGQSVVVKDEQASFEAETGQLTLDFDVNSLRDDVVRKLRSGGDARDRQAAYEYYLRACRLDEDDSTLGDAEQAYRHAIRLDPSLSNAFTNLGNLRYRQGDIREAERLYEQALEVDAEQPEAFYNLGFLLYERGDLQGAARHFRLALRADPSFADAHFNLAMTLEDLGCRGEARPHWERYLRLDPDSPWAAVARRRLAPN